MVSKKSLMKRFNHLLLVVLISAVFLINPISLNAAAAPTASSSWVSYGPDGKLLYKKDENGNRIMDFSSAGYKGGGVAIPDVPGVKTIQPSGGDDTAVIQKAIDEISAMPVKDGFRGALVLGPGTFTCSKQINIKTSGVVVRGSGSGDAGTVIQMSGAPFLLFSVTGSGSYSTSGSVPLTEAYVPSGTNTITVSSAADFKVGDTVLVTSTMTKDRIHFMGMDTLVRDGKPQTWISPGSKITTDRVIKSISGNTVTLDAPLTDALDSKYLGNPVATLAKYTYPGRISQVGLENFKVQAPAVVKAYQAVFMSGLIDSWARDILIQDGTNNFTMDKSTKQITVEKVIINHTVTSTDSAAPASFTCTGTQILFNKVQANDLKNGGKGSWAFVAQSQGTGPIVLLNFISTEKNGVAPHQRWTTGILVDSSNFTNQGKDALGIAFQNRGTSGSGHGWPMGWSVAWNVIAPRTLVSQASGSMNWCIGCVGGKSTAKDPAGVYDSYNELVNPGSLYLAQLKERMGPEALTKIGYDPSNLNLLGDQPVPTKAPATQTPAAASPAGKLQADEAQSALNQGDSPQSGKKGTLLLVTGLAGLLVIAGGATYFFRKRATGSERTKKQ